ncbi:MAG: PRD domain-containing protein [Corynebacterium flavescens]|nr:PRD domain-containing protein [Corynebacterium flavescens]
MHILRVFNNNVILARRGDEEVVVTGRGIGFQAKAGDRVDPARVAQLFVPAVGRDPDHSAAILAAIPGEYIQAVLDAMKRAELPDALQKKLTLVVALADHVHGAVKRSTTVTYPLEAEVRYLYSEDLALAKRLLREINSALRTPLPESEAVALTLHLVNAGFSVGDLSGTYRMTGLIQQLLEIISEYFGIEFHDGSTSVARFITHLRYLFVRMSQHAQLDSGDSPISRAIAQQHPRAADCAQLLSGVIELRFEDSLTCDEVSYLTLHIARLTEADK